MDALKLLADLTGIPGPGGQESGVREYVEGVCKSMGIGFETDAKGNLTAGDLVGERVVVTAHMDEIALMVTRVWESGELSVRPLGGMRVWKAGEGPVLVMSREATDGVLGFGSIHTTDISSTAVQAEAGRLDWPMARVATGLSKAELLGRGVKVGSRVVVHPVRRGIFETGDLVSGYFLDDRADVVSWLLALGVEPRARYVATTSEETGGEGALYALTQRGAEVCIALELGPVVPDSEVVLDSRPTVWTADSYGATQAADLDWIEAVGRNVGVEVQFQALSRGGSDASIAASHGLCARPVTLGLPMQNTHGFETIHRGAMDELAKLTAALVADLAG